VRWEVTTPARSRVCRCLVVCGWRASASSGLFGHGAMPNVPGDDEQFAGVEGQAKPRTNHAERIDAAYTLSVQSPA
jgi:hypothetical protein